jgi:hypothetical protein
MAVDKKQVAAALKLFEDFTGHEARVEGYADVPDVDDTMVVVGTIHAIAYTATREGETHLYEHQFSESAAPVLAVSYDGKRLYLLGGSYRFTHRGIEDC